MNSKAAGSPVQSKSLAVFGMILFLVCIPWVSVACDGERATETVAVQTTSTTIPVTITQFTTSATQPTTATTGAPAPAAADTAPCTWRILLIIFRDTDTDYLGEDGQWHHMSVSLDPANIDAMLTSLNGPVTAAVSEWSDDAVRWDVDVEYSPRPITSMSSPDTQGKQCVEVGSIRDVIDSFSPDGAYDQIMVYWAGDTLSASVPTPGWGIAYGYSPSEPWCYLTVEQAPTEWWNPSEADNASQVWIHEWLHCASAFYASQGFPMPALDADGAELQGYVQDQGGLPWWGLYYSDLMQGTVLENGRLLGITREAWLTGSPRTVLST